MTRVGTVVLGIAAGIFVASTAVLVIKSKPQPELSLKEHPVASQDDEEAHLFVG